MAQRVTLPNATVWQFAIPLWTVAVPISVGLAVAVGRDLRRRRQATTGRCVRCGYDLRASPDRCPECGTAPA